MSGFFAGVMLALLLASWFAIGYVYGLRDKGEDQ